ncbi:MAG: hypothetical protein E7018_06620 [Alphaproteobacteria bacterium]|nr:hypothetical protein [Alphaproteobacteria bacterium]
MNYEVEKQYTIAEDASGILYFFIKAKKNDPLNPQIIYDGFEHAVFMRSPEEKIILDYINPQVRDKLRKAKEVIVVESILENIKDSYYTSLNMVEKIPVDWSKIGLKTWEEIALQQQ